MLALIQRVTSSSVVVNGEMVGQIEQGITALIGIEKEDTEDKAKRLIEKILAYRIFPDDQDKMNASLVDTRGGLLLVPQFTLAADTKKGLRPSFSSAATPKDAKRLFAYAVDMAKSQFDKVESGVFGADMQVHLINDGPVTFMLSS